MIKVEREVVDGEKIASSSLWSNNEQMNELIVAKPDGTPQRICASWPNDVKPYLAALLRHPGSAPATIGIAALPGTLTLTEVISKPL